MVSIAPPRGKWSVGICPCQRQLTSSRCASSPPPLSPPTQIGLMISEMVHPWADSCLWTEVLRFKDVFALMVPVYAGLHLIPPVLFKRKQFMKK